MIYLFSTTSHLNLITAAFAIDSNMQHINQTNIGRKWAKAYPLVELDVTVIQKQKLTAETALQPETAAKVYYNGIEETESISKQKIKLNLIAEQPKHRQPLRYFLISQRATFITPRPKITLSFSYFKAALARSPIFSTSSQATILSQIICWNSFLMNPQSSAFLFSQCQINIKQNARIWQKNCPSSKNSDISAVDPESCPPVAFRRRALQSLTLRQTAHEASLAFLNSRNCLYFSILRQARLQVMSIVQTSNMDFFSSKYLFLEEGEAKLQTESKQGSSLLRGWYPSLKYWKVI